MSGPKIAVMSDLHCHPIRCGNGDTHLFSDGARNPATHHPIQSLLELIEIQKLKADILVCPGDLANKANLQGLCSGWGFVREIAYALNVKHIFGTLGNHDIRSRTRGVKSPVLEPRQILNSFPTRDKVACNSFWLNGYCIIDVKVMRNKRIRILIINSSMEHTNKKLAGKGSVTEALLSSLSNELKSLKPVPCQIAVCHHHPIQHENLGFNNEDLMDRGSRLTDLLEMHRYTLLVHGHRHHQRIKYATGGANAIPVFAAGSLSAHLTDDLARETSNLFNIIELNESKVDGWDRLGQIFSWCFHIGQGWVNPQYSPVKIPDRIGFGYREAVPTICKRVATYFRSRRLPVVPWRDLERKVPGLGFLIPIDLDSVRKELNEKHGLIVRPDSPAMPENIGKLSTS